MVFVIFNKVCTAQVRSQGICTHVQLSSALHHRNILLLQYFLWYTAFLPLIFPLTSLRLKWKGLAMIAVWLGGEVRHFVSFQLHGNLVFNLAHCSSSQLHWLYWAYYLEMQGSNTFFPLWLAGLTFFSVNVGVLATLMRHHSFTPLFERGGIFQLVPNGRPKQQ